MTGQGVEELKPLFRARAEQYGAISGVPLGPRKPVAPIISEDQAEENEELDEEANEEDLDDTDNIDDEKE